MKEEPLAHMAEPDEGYEDADFNEDGSWARCPRCHSTNLYQSWIGDDCFTNCGDCTWSEE